MWFLKLFWSFVQVIFLIAITLWLYFTFRGDVTLTWNEYHISTNAGVASAFLFAIFAFIIFFSHLIGDLIRLPSDLARRHRENKRAKGHQTLLRALSCASAGDYKNAYYLAHRAQKYLPETEQGLSLLLQAHAAKSQGKDQSAHDAFEALVKHPDTSVLGVQGLLQKRVLDGDVRGALELARAQYKAHPKNTHLLRPVYDLERRNALWNDALLTLDKLQSSRVIAKSEAETDRAVLWIILGDMAQKTGASYDAFRAYQKAYNADPSFAPAILRLVRAHSEKGQRLRAVSIAKKAIEKHFHPSFVQLWIDLKPNAQDTRWLTWFMDRAPPLAETYCALARHYMGINLWGEARAALMKAEKIEPIKDVYRLWVEIEEKNNADAFVVRQWLDRLEKASEGKGWMCRRTHRRFDDYVPVVEPEHLFNTVEWTSSDERVTSRTKDIEALNQLAARPSLLD